MISLAKYFFLFVLPFIISSCFLKKNKNEYQQQDSYQEISDINAHQKPSTMAKEIGKQQKGQQKAYLKQLRKAKRDMDKRNKKKLKRIVIKTKTKKTRGNKNKSDDKGNTKEIQLK